MAVHPKAEPPGAEHPGAEHPDAEHPAAEHPDAERVGAERPAECPGMRHLGEHDLGGHGNRGDGIALLEQGGRHYLYLAHERGPANFSVLDVTDPRVPELLTQTMLPHGSVRSNSLAV